YTVMSAVLFRKVSCGPDCGRISTAAGIAAPLGERRGLWRNVNHRRDGLLWQVKSNTPCQWPAVRAGHFQAVAGEVLRLAVLQKPGCRSPVTRRRFYNHLKPRIDAKRNRSLDLCFEIGVFVFPLM